MQRWRSNRFYLPSVWDPRAQVGTDQFSITHFVEVIHYKSGTVILIRTFKLMQQWLVEAVKRLHFPFTFGLVNGCFSLKLFFGMFILCFALSCLDQKKRDSIWHGSTCVTNRTISNIPLPPYQSATGITPRTPASGFHSLATWLK